MACGLGGEYDARARSRVRPGVVVMEQNTKLSADVLAASSGKFPIVRFNMRRLLGPIGDVPPAEFEAQYYEQAKVA